MYIHTYTYRRLGAQLGVLRVGGVAEEDTDPGPLDVHLCVCVCVCMYMYVYV